MEKVAEFLSPPPPPSYTTPNVPNFENKISPSVLLIIFILAFIFFVTGLLHLLVRYLLRPITREQDDPENATALQGQLQQLFHLHDSGVDQSFIDALPVFLYKAIIGIKNPFDCAVCLCEFEADDNLRLLPKCSHAFHINCIDTWLLSHSTCPLCRRSLIPEYCSPAHSPLVYVLESGSDHSSRDSQGDYLSHTGLTIDDAPVPSPKSLEAEAKEDANSGALPGVGEENIVSVKLGKFKSTVDVVGGGSSNEKSILDQRRCFSMGSYEYVMDDSSSLRVSITPPKNKPNVVKRQRKRVAMSECDCLSSRFMFKEFDASKTTGMHADGSNVNVSARSLSKKDSFSISKIWLQKNKEEKPCNKASSRRALSFTFPQNCTPCNESNLKLSVSPATLSEFNESVWEKTASELESDVETGDRGNRTISSRDDERPSFARRTLLWIVGRQNMI